MKQNFNLENLKTKILTTNDGKKIVEEPRFYGVPQMVTAGEQSKWLVPLKEEAVIVGAYCEICGQIYAPAYLEFCGNPKCRLAELGLVDLPDTGILAAEPVVTLFAPARMNGEAPFAHGMVYLGNNIIQATTAMMFELRTTTGVIRRGIYGHNTQVKVVFLEEKSRTYSITDCFCLPQSELSLRQINKSPLLITDIEWNEPSPPKFSNDRFVQAMPQILSKIENFFAAVNKSPKNQKRLKEINFTISVITGGGGFIIYVWDGQINLKKEPESGTTPTMAVENPDVFYKWTEGLSLTNSFALGEIWLSNMKGVRILEDLDRLHRAANRDGIL